MQIRLRVVALPFLGILVSALLVTAAPTPTAERVERVTIKKADGTTVAGELMWADHDGVGVRATPKAEAVLVPWKNVTSISNGLTRQTAINKWKEKHKELLCGVCQGDRTVKHEACGGTGIATETKKDCQTCKGSGAGGKCTNAKCKEGKVPCSGPCLKPSVGTWVLNKDDGKRWRSFPTRSGRQVGNFRISDGHFGEVWELSRDGSTMESKGQCTVCRGEAQLECSTCSGKGHLPCKPCAGVGVVGPACKDCTGGQVKCMACKGKGLAPRG
jgi:hypothetical protein